MARGVKLTNERIIEALHQANGIIKDAADALNMERPSLSHRVNEDDELRKACDEAMEAMLDVAESKLFEAIEGLDVSAIRFLLSTRGKKRGYVQRQEVTGENGGPLQHDVAGSAERLRNKLADLQSNMAGSEPEGKG